MNKLLLLALFLLNISFASAQKPPKGIWQHSEEKYIYTVYLDRQFLEITDYTASSYPKGGITLSKRLYGFYNSCDVPSIDSLQTSGTYYFEIYEDDINEDGSLEDYECLELSFYEEGGAEFINIYRSSQQQFSTFRKVNKLPKNLEDYLRKEHPEVYRKYSNL
jgi:hypothetical protein